MHRLSMLLPAGEDSTTNQGENHRELYTEYRDGTLDPYLNRLNKENEAAYDQIIHHSQELCRCLTG